MKIDVEAAAAGEGPGAIDMDYWNYVEEREDDNDTVSPGSLSPNTEGMFATPVASGSVS